MLERVAPVGATEIGGSVMGCQLGRKFGEEALTKRADERFLVGKVAVEARGAGAETLGEMAGREARETVLVDHPCGFIQDLIFAEFMWVRHGEQCTP